MDWNRFRLGQREHAFIVGLTGSGKTEFAQHFINDRYKRRSVVFDPKHSETISGWRHQTYIYSWQELVRSKAPRIVWRPSKAPYLKDGRFTNQAEDADWQEKFFQFVFERQYTRLCVDEAAVLPGGSHPSFHLRQCIQLGRELGISCVCLTQRPASVPLAMMSEASRVVVFRLNLEEDMKRIEKITGFTIEQQQTLMKHEFLYYSYEHGRYPTKLKLNLSNVRGYPSPLSEVPRPLFGAPGYLDRSYANASSGASAS